MTDLHAFQLRGLALEDLDGMTISYGSDTRLFDIKAALVEGNGTIVTNDNVLAGTLTGHEYLETASVPSDPVLVAVPGGGENTQTDVPVTYTPQSGEQGLIAADAPAEHEPEAETVEAAQAQGAPASVPPVEPETEEPDTNDEDTDPPNRSFGR